jgi:hypothetical protein
MTILALGLLASGCATTTVTNLTAKQTLRNANGLYPVEVALSSRQQTLRWPTIKANAVMDSEAFSMRLTPLMTNRWETLIPVPPGKNVVYFRFKFDYMYDAFASPGRMDSLLSPIYRLQILDK